MAAEAPDLDPHWCRRVQAGLADWYDRGHRELPWRRDRDPYRILVSEAMLVQTTVAAVIPYFERFLARFPTVQSLAEADEADVLKAWEGLGYYRRARQLQAAARAIVHDHGGRMPEDLEAIRSLPGVGRYIAGAIASFAFDRPAPIVEANTQRVLARLLAWEEEISKSASQKRLWDAAGRLVPDQQPGRFNQAFMELGATVCTPRVPLCLICPVASSCHARMRGIQDRIPVKAGRPAPLDVVESCALVRRGGGLLMLRRGPGRLWDGFWEFPTIHVSGADPAGRAFDAPVTLEEGVRRLSGVTVALHSDSHRVKFGVTRHRVELTGTVADDLGGGIIPYSGYSEGQFASPREMERFSMGAAVRKMARWAIGRLLEGH